MLVIACSQTKTIFTPHTFKTISKTNILYTFSTIRESLQNGLTLAFSKHLSKTFPFQQIFLKPTLCIHSQRYENHCKVFPNLGVFKIFSNLHEHKEFFSDQAIKSSYITTDEKGANTFPFHNLPPWTQENYKMVFSVLFTLSFIG